MTSHELLHAGGQNQKSYNIRIVGDTLQEGSSASPLHSQEFLGTKILQYNVLSL